jgi:flavin reductase
MFENAMKQILEPNPFLSNQMMTSRVVVDPDAKRATPDSFKHAMRTLMGGVCAVTAKHAEEVIGVTVTAACSVSADEPLVLICLNRSGRAAGPIAELGRFGLSVLSARQQSAATYFARSGEVDQPRFQWDGDCPTIDGALARLVCVSQHQVQAGTHLVIIALVEHAAITQGQPLGYVNGAYCTAAPNHPDASQISAHD